ncbi:MAG: alpha/beta family hydrolase [Myxococcota bacterium]
MSETLRDGPDDAAWTLVLAHGAGAPMDSPFMNTIASLVGSRGVAVVRFEFDYMAKRREDGKKRGPDRGPKLAEKYRAVISSIAPAGRLVIGGKSMGGRIASMIADDAGVAGLVCLGYPFHPPGRPERLRTAHLQSLATPALIVQGTRDRFGTPEEVRGYALSRSIEVAWMEDGDHSLKPRKKSGRTEAQNLEGAVDAIVAFVEQLTPR